jgi:hypothetical protein
VVDANVESTKSIGNSVAIRQTNEKTDHDFEDNGTIQQLIISDTMNCDTDSRRVRPREERDSNNDAALGWVVEMFFVLRRGSSSEKYAAPIRSQRRFPVDVCMCLVLVVLGSVTVHQYIQTST